MAWRPFRVHKEPNMIYTKKGSRMRRGPPHTRIDITKEETLRIIEEQGHVLCEEVGTGVDTTRNCLADGIVRFFKEAYTKEQLIEFARRYIIGWYEKNPLPEDATDEQKEDRTRRLSMPMPVYTAGPRQTQQLENHSDRAAAKRHQNNKNAR